MPGRLTVTRVVWILLLAAALPAAAGEVPPPAVGGALAEFTLPPPADPEQRAYLGLKGDRPFPVSGIDAQVVIVEIFNMY